MNNWKYYNHAVIPTTAPDADVDITDVESGSIWKQHPKALLARWTTDWDCEHETNWWYVIKDTPFEISELKSKRRYEINKGVKNFYVKKIGSADYCEDLFHITVSAYEGWPEKYRPTVDREQFIREMENPDDGNIFYGIFGKDDNKIQGYAILAKDGRYLDFRVLRTLPECESLGINAALVFGILEDNRMFLSSGGYICDGSRSIRHETAFQDYLEKYFCFRKAYCKLHIKYKTWFGLCVRVLYPMRKMLGALDRVNSVHQINGVLKMEEIRRVDQ